MTDALITLPDPGGDASAGAKSGTTGRRRAVVSLVLGLFLLTLWSEPARGQAGDELWKTYMDGAGRALESKNYDEAESFYKLAEARAKGFGELDERYVSTLANLTGVYLLQKKHAETDTTYKRLLAALEKGAGRDSLNSASLVASLASMFEARERYGEAEPLRRLALAIYKRGMKPGDKEVIYYLNFLGSNYFLQGKIKEAEAIFKEELAFMEADPVLSKQMLAAYTLGYLSLISQRYGRDDEAEKYLDRAIEVVKNLRGENHPETAAIIKARAVVLIRQDARFPDAVKAMQQVLRIDEAIYGKASKEVSSDLQMLAFVYRHHGSYDEALPLLTRSLDILKVAPDVQPKDFYTSAGDLADTHALKNNYVEGESVCKSMTPVFEKKGQRTPETDLMVNQCLQNVYYHSGDYAAEVEALKNAIMIEEKLGPPAEKALTETLFGLVSSFLRQKRYEDALAALRRAEKIYDKTSPEQGAEFQYLTGRYHYFTGKYGEGESAFARAIALLEPKKDVYREMYLAQYRKGYALLLYAQGRTAQGEEMFRKAVDAFRLNKMNGERNAAAGYQELAELLVSQKKYAEAEPLYRRAIESREKVLGLNHPEVAASLEGYAELLRGAGRAAEAGPLETRARAIREKKAAR